MKPNLVLITLLLIAVAAVWFIQQPTSPELQSSLLFDKMQQHAIEIDSIEIENAQGLLLKASKTAQGWQAQVAPQLPVYPVSKEKLATLVSTLSQVELIEPKTAKAQHYHRLGVQDIERQDSLASLVTINTPKNQWSVLVGNPVNFTDGSYVRLPKSKQSWRTNKTVALPSDKYVWLKQPILPFATQDVQAIARVDTPKWTITQQDEGEFSLSPLPQDRELVYPSVLSDMVDSLLAIKFQQLKVKEQVDPQTYTPLAELELTLSNGNTIQLRLSEKDGENWLAFSADMDSDYWQPWYYQISSFSAQQLTKGLDDFSLKSTEPALEQHTTEAQPQNTTLPGT